MRSVYVFPKEAQWELYVLPSVPSADAWLQFAQLS